MAYSATLQAPGPFQFNSPDEWQGQSGEDASSSIVLLLDWLKKTMSVKSVHALQYCLGEEADDVLTSTNISSDSRQVFADVLKKFNEFFKVRKTSSLRELASIDAVRGKQKLQNSLSFPYTASQQIVNSAS